MKRLHPCVLAAALALPPAMAEEAGYTFSAGGDYSEGDYGTGTSSSIWSLPLTLDYSGERVAWSVSVPYLIVTAPEGFVFFDGAGLQLNKPTSTGGTTAGSGSGTGAGGPSGVATGATTGIQPATRTVSGLGDVTTSLSLRLIEEGDLKPWMALTGKIKFATADVDQGLGTGENDEALQLEWAKGPVNGYVGRKWFGDTATADFRDVWYGAVAATYVAEGGGDAGLELYGEEAPLPGNDARRELTLYGSYPLGTDVRLQGYVLKGLSDGSPDFGAGLALQYAL